MKQVVALFSLVISLSVFSQTGDLERLQNQRKNLQAEIENTNRLYLNVKKQTTTIIQRINLINKQIENRKKIIAVQNQEIAALDNELSRLQKEIEVLNRELKQRQDKYANAIKTVMHKRQSENKIFFILSGKSFGETLRRMQYLKQYSRMQKNQADEIKEKNAELQKKRTDIEQAKIERSKTLAAIRTEQSKLIEEEQNRKSEMNEAQGKQKELQKVLQDKQKQANRLNSEIEKLIAEEVARQEREARRLEEEQRKKRAEEQRLAEEKRLKEQKKKPKREKAEPEKEIPERTIVKEEPLIAEAETFNLSKNFVANKGSLPMPVTGAATIVSKFGINKHAEWNVSTNNSGIDIQAQNNADIRSIFDGEVSRIIAFPGYNNCVILRHGDYYTFYANIINVYVKQGQKVKTGEALGKIYTDSDTGVSTMHFQLWNKTTKLNPAPWLKK
ncbi:MAG: peptidoglycan DD-metalloendopeptidase family protein [Dysgonamonadaceae bacterium]|jgi:septal ring factor EnvC (AmiA/AmiB activator)|nr:peptidoglycan DD-metalloendopeptidase family protein [Dysgonamonadaceae bacterium]MDD3355802.1 peptidoglycan DD-metalloendopeptidase family protein [Dysgonamonadaceae bacterium]MDD3726805.1 peptidoglycan DD-metalloendopeptidase family protein [Dysgonamonadaceae bacterium]MDD4245835.1 peptidoglycan DD-metalloendopeptidase family protein [Dysgonamonadaceae bacterium]MDD4604835.1 peptidoglycan DD-metalloendopeptidase family protein [Dysgonamonadaceae bacterium]